MNPCEECGCASALSITVGSCRRFCTWQRMKTLSVQLIPSSWRLQLRVRATDRRYCSKPRENNGQADTCVGVCLGGRAVLGPPGGHLKVLVLSRNNCPQLTSPGSGCCPAEDRGGGGT
ncbi:unnamed protein product [Pleuronectes platessa]|uniref:Uncharacterized protein n=1 Tax=Pleuronectes platessa TaxID=8262 RepID=A0A9N7TY08_PLEPL|nr:unnamed protein product [Pleuronectes platessa]